MGGGGQDLIGPYYHVHNYIHFINMLSKALNTALVTCEKRYQWTQ